MAEIKTAFRKPTGREVRLSALRRLAVLVPASALMGVVIWRLNVWGFGVPGPIQIIPFALPFAYSLAALVELALGIDFAELSSKWEDLKGWQRGAWGCIIVPIACAALFVAMAIVLTFFGF